jgi:regulatory protein
VDRDAYLTALHLLARRELSEAQLRQRLTRRHHTPDDIDTAVERLKADRSLNDERVAAAIARTEVGLRKRGRLRVRRTIEAAGIAPDIARRAADEAFADVEPDELMAAALARRLPAHARITDDRTLRRLYRYLVSQGFEPERALALLRSRQA